MYGPYYNAASLERIDNQIKDLESMRSQLQNRPAINQTFQAVVYDGTSTDTEIPILKQANISIKKLA